MSTNSRVITVSEIPVEIVRKDIKNLHLAVNPPDGAVRVAVPKHVTDDNVRLAVISKLPWIRKHQAEFHKQPRQSERRYVTGESHYFQGKRYLLEVVERYGKHELILRGNAKMVLYVRPGTSEANRARVFNEWYRVQLKAAIPALLKKWQPTIGREANRWGVKKMKTKWGSCNIDAKAIWLNLELAKKPPECLEYILVHELAHLHERRHNDNFRRLMDKFLPNWRHSRDILKSEPLAHEDWGY